jgi:hypothetical protein
MITALQATEQSKGLRQSIIEAIRQHLTEKDKKDIEFDDTLVYNVIDTEGENESISGYKLGSGDVEDTIYTTFYGAEQSEYGVEDMTTDQLIWILTQIESDSFEDVEDDEYVVGS